jgi:SAM-dependent methyltransferase
MCSISCIEFVAKTLSKEEVTGKRIIEVGSYDVNGSCRKLIEFWRPAQYIGVDIQKGPGVDVICNAENLVEKFGKESFDIVVSTEMLEHVRDWRKVISNIKNICKLGGRILITTRSYGMGGHGFPYDFWRYEIEDMKEIFSDCKTLSLERDYSGPGVFIKLKKPNEFAEKDLSNYKLFCIVSNMRVKEITNEDLHAREYNSAISHVHVNYLQRAIVELINKRAIKELIARVLTIKILAQASHRFHLPELVLILIS